MSEWWNSGSSTVVEAEPPVPVPPPIMVEEEQEQARTSCECPDCRDQMCQGVCPPCSRHHDCRQCYPHCEDQVLSCCGWCSYCGEHTEDAEERFTESMCPHCDMCSECQHNCMDC